MVISLAATIVLALLTFAVHRREQQHLLDLQVDQAATTLAAALPLVETQLDDGLQVAEATQSPADFERFMKSTKSSEIHFRSVSLWRQEGGTAHLLALIGPNPGLVSDGRTAVLSRLVPSAKISVLGILPVGSGAAIGFADLPAGSGGLIAYAESALPAGRHLKPPRGAFGDIQFALYLNATRPEDLLESTVPTPIRSRRATASAPFGDATILLVGTPTVDLAGGLAATLPWIVLGAGLALTVAGGGITEVLLRRRRLAETLAEENERLYLEQRNIATTVQHALLPEMPKLEDLEVGARYLSGTEGTEVGGDWYDVVSRPGKCVFVVGDVSGRGLRAATTMASLRFAIRAYLAEGHGPEDVVSRLGRLHDFDGEDVFATLLVGEVDIAHRRVTLVDAGHPPPLMVTSDGASFLDVSALPPIGVDFSGVASTTVDIPPGALLIAYTDGLTERREEPLDAGMERLRAARIDPGEPMEQLLDRLVETLLPQGPVDDTAILALRWRP